MKLLIDIRKTPWFILLSRLCATLGVLLLAQFGVRLFRDGTGCFADYTRITLSGRPTDLEMIVLFVAWTEGGLILCAADPVPRKTVLISAGAGAAAGIMIAGTVNERVWTLILCGVLVGIAGSLYEPLFGKKARAEWEEKHPLKRLFPDPLPSEEIRKAIEAEKEKNRGRKRKGGSGISASGGAVLTLSSVILFSVIHGIHQVRDGDSGWFSFFCTWAALYLLVLYLVLVQTEEPFFISLFTCRILHYSAIGIAGLYVLHFMHFSPFTKALLTSGLSGLGRSAWWPDHILLSLILTHILLSLILTLTRCETRKTVVAALPVCGIFLIHTAARMYSYDLEELKDWTLLTTETAAMLWPLFAGFYALRMKRYFEDDIRSDWLKKKKHNEQIRALERKKQLEAIQTAARKKYPGHAPSSGAPHTPRPAAQTPAATATPPVSSGVFAAQQTLQNQQKEVYLKRESVLEKKKAEYESARETAAESDVNPETDVPRRDDASPARQLLPEAVKRLFPGGQVLATLDGQRQLLVWLTDGVPGLEVLRQSAAVRELMRPELPDDPEQFVPLLNRVGTEACSILEEMKRPEREKLREKSTVQLCGGWFALKMYERIGASPEVFDRTAEEIAGYLDARKGDLRRLISGGGDR